MNQPHTTKLFSERLRGLVGSRLAALLVAMAILSVGMGVAQDASNYMSCSRYALEASHTPPASTAFTRPSSQPVATLVMGTSADGVATGPITATLWPHHTIRSYQYYFTRCMWGR